MPIPRAEAAPGTNPREGWLAFCKTFLAALLIYATQVHRGIPAGDSGELITVAHTLGTAHPPGYPLWTLLAALWERVVPIGSVALRLNLFSAVAAALAVACVARAIPQLPGAPRSPEVRRVATFVAALALAFAPPFWKNALVAEVFALNALLAAIALLAFVALLRCREERRPPDAPLAVLGLVGGLLVVHHHSLVLLWLPLVLVAAVLAWRAPPPARPTRRGVLVALAVFGLALLPLLYLPWAAARTPPAPLAWGDPVTPARLLHVLLRVDYGTFQLDPQQAGLSPDRSHALLWLASLPRDFQPWGVALGLIGLVAMARDPRRRPLVFAIGGFLALQLAFFSRIGFPTVPAVYLGVVERFYILPAVAFALAIGVGAGAVLAWIDRWSDSAWPTRVAQGVLVFLFVFGGPLHGPRARAIDQHANRLVGDLADDVLASVPDSAVLFVQGDLFHNAIAVRQLVEGARPDVTVLDQELLTYDWSVARARRLHPGVLPPRLGPEDRYDGSSATGNGAWIEHLRTTSTRRAAFLGLKEASYAERSAMVPVGFVLWAVPKDSVPGRRAQAETALAVFARLRIDSAFRGYDPTSFEALERVRMTECLARTTRLLCAPPAFALRPGTTPGFADLLGALERSRRAPLTRPGRLLPNPPEDPEVVRARGYLFALHPAVRDSVQAEADLAATLAREPAGARADEARSVLAWLRQKRVAATGPAVP